jgi:membrane protein implicated in regulation of membrane protease activity
MEFSNIFEMPYMPFALLAFGGGLLFTIQLLLSFIGVGMDTEGSGIGDLGASDYSFKFLSIMSISSFCMVGGIFGLYALTLFDPDSGWRIPAAVITTLITGGIMVYLSGLISSALAKIQGSGTVKAANAVGKTAKVYLTIKPGKIGRVEVDVQGRRKYIDAVAQDPSKEFKTGELVKVVSVKDEDILVVTSSDS